MAVTQDTMNRLFVILERAKRHRRTVRMEHFWKTRLQHYVGLIVGIIVLVTAIVITVIALCQFSQDYMLVKKPFPMAQSSSL